MRCLTAATAVLALALCNGPAAAAEPDTCRLVYGGAPEGLDDGTAHSVLGVLRAHADTVACEEDRVLLYEDPEEGRELPGSVVHAFNCTAVGAGEVYTLLIGDLAALPSRVGGVLFRGRVPGHDELPCAGAPRAHAGAAPGGDGIVREPCCPYAAPSVRWFFKPSNCADGAALRCSGASRNWCANAVEGGNLDPASGRCLLPLFN